MSRPRSPARRLARVLAGALLLSGLAIGTRADLAAAAPLNECAQSDNGDPVVTDLQISPLQLDVTSQSRTFTVTATAHDTGGPGPATGIGFFSVMFDNPDPSRSDLQVILHRSGAQWTATGTLPRWSPSGTWSVQDVYTNDRVRGYADYSAQDVANHGWDTGFEVVSTPDTSNPLVRSFDISPGTVDTRSKQKKVTFTAKVTDAEAGVDSVVVSGRTLEQFETDYVDLKKVKGQPSTYRGSLTIPRWRGNGTWAVDNLYAGDRVGNHVNLDDVALRAHDFDTSFRILSRLDKALPKVAALTSSPSSIDVRTTAATVRATVRATDAGSGVREAYVLFVAPDGYSFYLELHRKSGTPKDGVWKGSVEMDPCEGVPGSLDRVVYVYDGGGNVRTDTDGGLTVQAADHVAPTVEGPQTLGVGDNVNLTFSEDVNGISTSSIVMLSDYTNPVTGTWSCTDATATSTPCATGRVRTATFHPTALLPAATLTATINPPGILDVTDLAGNPILRWSLYMSVQ